MRRNNMILALLTICLSVLPSEAEAQWEQASNGLPASADPGVSSLVVSGTHLFAGTGGPNYGGSSNGVYVSTDNGSTWRWANIGVANAPARTLMASGTDLFAGTGNPAAGGGVYFSTNNGTTWTSVSFGLPGNEMIISLAVSGTNLFAGTQDDEAAPPIGSGVYRSTNNGTSWSPVNTGMVSSAVFSLVFSGTSLFAGTNDGVYRSTDDGTSWKWTTTDLPPYTTVKALAVLGSNFFASAASGVICSSNNGTTWTTANTPFSAFNSMAQVGSKLFAGTPVGVYCSTDNGSSWIGVNTGLTSSSIYSLAVSGTTLFAGTASGLFCSTDYGTTWTAVNIGLTYIVVNTLAISGSNLFAGTDHAVFHSTDSGTSWTKTSTGLPDTNINALSFSGTSLFAGTGDGMFLSTNNGLTWNAAGLTNTNVFTLMSVGTTLYAGAGGVSRSTDSGTTWTVCNNGLEGPIYAFSVIDTNIFAAGAMREVFMSTNSGTNWTVNYGLQNTFVLALATFDHVLLAGQGGFDPYNAGGIERSTNYGTTWTVVNTGLPIGENRWVYSFAIVGADILAGALGGVFLSTNTGTTWTDFNSGLPTNTLISNFAVGNSWAFAATGNGVWRKQLSDALPIQLASFKVTGTTLNWTTVSETNNYGFDIQRNGTKIAFVPGHGTTIDQHTYSFVDNPPSGKYEYQLKQIDLDGTAILSEAIMVDVGVPVKFALSQNYPNPFNPSTRISFSITKDGPATLRVYDVLGREVATLVNENRKAGQYTEQFNGNGVASGVYMYVLKTSEGQLVGRMILLK